MTKIQHSNIVPCFKFLWRIEFFPPNVFHRQFESSLFLRFYQAHHISMQCIKKNFLIWFLIWLFLIFSWGGDLIRQETTLTFSRIFCCHVLFVWEVGRKWKYLRLNLYFNDENYPRASIAKGATPTYYLTKCFRKLYAHEVNWAVKIHHCYELHKCSWYVWYYSQVHPKSLFSVL